MQKRFKYTLLVLAALLAAFCGRIYWQYDAEILPNYGYRLGVFYVFAELGEASSQRDLGVLYATAAVTTKDEKRRMTYERRRDYWFGRAGFKEIR